MTEHLTDEIPRLLTGEADREVTLAAAEHLRTCVDCQHELVSAVVAHASLSSAQRFAPEIVTRPQRPAGDAGPAVHPEPAPLPDLSAVFAQVRREADEDFGDLGAAKHAATPRRRRYLVLAAAAVVVAGAAGGIYAATTSNEPTPAMRTVALAAFDQGTTNATARVGNGTVELTATSLPRVAGKRYEVWLTDAKRTRMQPIGWIGADGTARMTVPDSMMRQYNDLEVSVQSARTTSYQYSGTSVLRGPIG
jgi:hypothetical protein